MAMMAYLRDFFRVLNLPCKEHTRLLTRELDEPLSRGEQAGLRLHLLICRGCYRFKKQVRYLRSLIAADLKLLEQGAEMPAAVRERLSRMIRERTEPRP